MATKSISAIDRHVGARIRMQRMVRGLSQTELGKAVGVTFQQVQKYEAGRNRVSSSRLQRIADALKVDPKFFFDEVPVKAVGKRIASAEMTTIDEFISSREGIALSQAFTKIRNAQLRRYIVLLVEQVAQS